MLQVLDPNVKHSEYPLHVPLAKRFPNFLPDSKMQQLDNEWRRLSIVSLPFSYDTMDPEEFFHRLSKISDGTGTLSFGVLCQFMQTLLCLPHANVDVERTFSDVSVIKTKKSSKTKDSSRHLAGEKRSERGRWMRKVHTTQNCKEINVVTVFVQL